MLSPNQIRCLNNYYASANANLYFCCERHDCDYEQMQEMVNALDPLLPGKGLDYEAILSKDSLASDALLIHCNQTIGRLDAIYKRMMNMYDDSSRSEYTINKRTTVNVPPDWANPSFHDGKVHFQSEHNGTEKIETTSFPDKQRFKILETAMKCLDRSVKIQITCTQRREKLLNRKDTTRLAASQRGSRSPSTDSPHTPETSLSAMRGMQGYSLSETTAPFDLNNSREFASMSGSPSQPEASARNAVTTTPNFGPPKDFTPLPSIAEVRLDHYAWRKELKAKQAARHTSPSQPEASARNAATTNNMAHKSKDDKPATYSPAPHPAVSIRGSASIPHHQRE